MTVNVVRKVKRGYEIEPTEMVEGEAYEDENGVIYISNLVGQIMAFSICGESIVYEDDERSFRKVNLTITVE